MRKSENSIGLTHFCYSLTRLLYQKFLVYSNNKPHFYKKIFVCAFIIWLGLVCALPCLIPQFALNNRRKLRNKS